MNLKNTLLTAAVGLMMTAFSAQSADIKISSLPFQIVAPGTYVLTGNLSFSAQSGVAINILPNLCGRFRLSIRNGSEQCRPYRIRTLPLRSTDELNPRSHAKRTRILRRTLPPVVSISFISRDDKSSPHCLLESFSENSEVRRARFSSQIFTPAHGALEFSRR